MRLIDPLVTSRLVLSELGHADADFIIRLLNDADFLRNIGDRGVRGRRSAMRYLENGPMASYREHGCGLWRVSLASDDTPIGICGLLRREGMPDPDLGFAFLPAYRGQGYAAEAAVATLDWGWRNLDSGQFLAIVSPGNEDSIRLLRRLGFRYQRLQPMPGSAEKVKLYSLQRRRCAWARTPLSIAYHDREWGVPVHDDRVLFEFLTLEGAQAGLSWETILRKREGYRKAFSGFDPARVARYTPARVERLLGNEGIVRHRLKIESTITNARAFLKLQREFGSFDAFLWGLAGNQVHRRQRSRLKDVPARTELSDRLSKALRQRGFRFVGSTICYAFLQAVGVVDDHTSDCFRAMPRPAR